MYNRLDSSLGLIPVSDYRTCEPSVKYNSPLVPPNWHGKNGQLETDDQNNLWSYSSKYASWILQGKVEVECVTGKPTQTCEHKWATYVGLLARFEFCEKCDLKK